MSSIPDELTIGSELHRKVFDEMTRVWSAFLNGRATLTQTKAKIETIWGIASGLIGDPEFMSTLDYMTQALDAVSKRYDCRSAEVMLFESLTGKRLMIVRHQDQDDPTITKMVSFSQSGERSWSTTPGVDFRDSQTAMIDKLRASGFEMIAFN